ncbi:MAG: hypothetical protein C0510_06160 [Erythrobacter sp.]|nr:hypothetical protein [Erythrobacter sp.]
MRHDFWIASLALLFTASCAHAPREAASRAASPDHDRLAFVQAACGGCHAVEGEAISPNPLSPTFAAIANRPGLDAATLSSWLRDAHNYPEVMDFDLSDEQIEMVAGHMLTLRDPAWRPLPD